MQSVGHLSFATKLKTEVGVEEKETFSKGLNRRDKPHQQLDTHKALVWRIMTHCLDVEKDGHAKRHGLLGKTKGKT